MIKFKPGLFDLTEEQEKTVKMMYKGKIIKCLVAPYHSFKDLESSIPYTKSTYLFPEREMSEGQANSLISNLVSSDITDEIIIITTQMGIILDMVDGVHVLTQNGTIVDGNTKTFMANIHTIRYDLLENSDHRNGSEPIEETAGSTATNNLITEIRDLSGETIPQSEYTELKKRVDIIGEDVIRNILSGMLEDVKVSKSKWTSPIDKLIDAYSKSYDNPENYIKLTYEMVNLYRVEVLSDAYIMMKL